MLKIGSDFSGVGAFDMALKRIVKDYKTVFACDMDKYARQTYIANHGEPDYFPENVYNREIPAEPLDIYMTSPPCQSFSLAGKRGGEGDDRGVLFYNSHEFIKTNRPRYFIFENVKGLLSDNNGTTFKKWIDYLAKSVNGTAVIFPHDQSAMYHVYHKVMNSKDYGVPQNRERVFIIGIRDDKDNSFIFPPKEHLTKKLKDVLESEVDEKYYLSENAIKSLESHKEKQQAKGNGFHWTINDGTKNAFTIISNEGTTPTGNYIKTHSLYPRSSTTGKGGTGHLTKEDGTTYAIDTGNSQAVEWVVDYRYDEGLRIRKDNNSPALCVQGEPPLIKQQQIRRLTPRECFRLQDFEDSFILPCSDNQSYKQAGNSITVGVLERIIKRILLSL